MPPGAGLALALFGDVVIAAESSVLLTAYAGIGLSPDCGTTWRLPQLVGSRRAGDMLLHGRRLSAAEALDWGIVTHVERDDDLAGAGIRAAEELARAPHPATGATARLLRGDRDALARHLDQEAAAIAAAAGSGDAATLINRFARGTAGS